MSRRNSEPNPVKPMPPDIAAEWLGMSGRGSALIDWAKRGKIGFYRPTQGVYLFGEHHLWDYLFRKEHEPDEQK